MSFWSNIQSYIGKTSFGVQLIDKLGQEQGSGGWVAGLYMNTYAHNNHYLLTNRKYDEAPLETVSVYFLSWKLDDVTKVSFQTLSKFDYFLTSEFSGCRFVVTEVGVAHIAWSAGGNRDKGVGSQELRDASEFKELSYGSGLPKYRRRLSLSSSDKLTGALDKLLKGSDNSAQSYDNERAMVFGYRVQGGWAFKVLRYAAAEGSSKGTWSNLACVWAK